jgi:hypothetical protein
VCPMPKRALTSLTLDCVKIVPDGTAHAALGTLLHHHLRDHLIVGGASLTHLHLSGLAGGDSEKMCSLLRGLPSWTLMLSHLALVTMHVASDAFGALQDSLAQDAAWVHMVSFTFGGGDVISSHGMGYLCSALLRDERIRTLVLDGAVLDYFSVGQLGQLIRESETLRLVSLVGVPLGAVYGSLRRHAKVAGIMNSALCCRESRQPCVMRRIASWSGVPLEAKFQFVSVADVLNGFANSIGYSAAPC